MTRPTKTLLRLEWLLCAWILLIITSFGSSVTFAYGGHSQTTDDYDDNGKSGVVYDAGSVLAKRAAMMERGMGYDAAHAAALQKYGVSPFSVYPPQVIQALPGSFNQKWFNFWGIGR